MYTADEGMSAGASARAASFSGEAGAPDPDNLNGCFLFCFVFLLKFHPIVTSCKTELGATLSVVLDLSFSICIWISSVVAIIYTVLGGLYSVACTDVIQILLVLFGVVSF